MVISTYGYNYIFCFNNFDSNDIHYVRQLCWETILLTIAIWINVLFVLNAWNKSHKIIILFIVHVFAVVTYLKVNFEKANKIKWSISIWAVFEKLKICIFVCQ